MANHQYLYTPRLARMDLANMGQLWEVLLQQVQLKWNDDNIDSLIRGQISYVEFGNTLWKDLRWIHFCKNKSDYAL